MVNGSKEINHFHLILENGKSLHREKPIAERTETQKARINIILIGLAVEIRGVSKR